MSKWATTAQTGAYAYRQASDRGIGRAEQASGALGHLPRRTSERGVCVGVQATLEQASGALGHLPRRTSERGVCVGVQATLGGKKTSGGERMSNDKTGKGSGEIKTSGGEQDERR